MQDILTKPKETVDAMVAQQYLLGQAAMVEWIVGLPKRRAAEAEMVLTMTKRKEENHDG